ncbi:MAG: ABC transporter permease [Oscillospiraceae bacterium]|jgi:ABC-2 type transport system permease protein|nr:ABC transporter permease [Oscillospiraceae bacterium]
MKQFFTIFKFELGSFFKNKVFMGLTIAIVVILGVGLSFPRITGLFSGHDENDENIAGGKESAVIAINVADDTDSKVLLSFFERYLAPGIKAKAVDLNEKDLVKAVKDGDYNSAIFMTSPTSYKYIKQDNSLNDSTMYTVNEILLQTYRHSAMIGAGLSEQETGDILSSSIKSEMIITGNDQTQSFFYTYAIIMILYFALLIYGQFVSQSVANEKSSRAMELLITSAKPTNLMFGKVLGAGLAGLTQLALILFASYGFYTINKNLWKDTEIIQSIFGMPLEILFYAILFFVLGFFVYAFLYGAFSSLASKMEELNALVMPVTYTFVAAFLIVITSIAGGNMDSTLMRVSSYIPLTSPMAMFARIAMGNVEAHEIIISVAVLVISIAAIGYAAAGIYRAGVLMYGNKPSLSTVVKLIKKDRPQNKA